MKFFKDFDQNSGCQAQYQIILKELDDHRILDKFFQDLIRIFQEVDDHRILMKFFKDFYQNSSGQPQY